MTKSDIMKHVASRTGITRKDAEAAVASFLQIIEDTLSLGQSVQLSGFGKFSVKVRPAAEIRHPRTGETMRIDKCLKIHFKAAPSLKETARGNLISETQEGSRDA